MFTLISLVAVAVLILRKSAVQLRVRILWCLVALLAFLTPGIAIAIVDGLAPRWPFRAILTPFAAVFELAAPWIAFAVFNDKTSPAEETEAST